MAQLQFPAKNVTAEPEGAPEFRRGGYISGLAANLQYVKGDLVTIVPGLPGVGGVQKWIPNADGAFGTAQAGRAYIVGQDYILNPGNLISTTEELAFRSRGVPLDVFRDTDTFIMSLVQDAAGTRITPTSQADIDTRRLAVVGNSFDLTRITDGTDILACVSQGTTTNPKVVVIELLAKVGDINPMVRVKFLPAVIGA